MASICENKKSKFLLPELMPLLNALDSLKPINLHFRPNGKLKLQLIIITRSIWNTGFSIYFARVPKLVENSGKANRIVEYIESVCMLGEGVVAWWKRNHET